MPDIVIQIAGLLALLVLTGLGYRHWVSKRTLTLPGKALLVLLLLTLVGGLLGSTGWWADDPRSFPWDLPPLAARLLAAAGWAFGVPTFLALQRPTPPRLRLALLMLVTYLVPLLLAILVFHLDRFDFSAPIAVAFFVIVLLLSVPASLFLLRQPLIIPAAPGDLDPPVGQVKGWLGVLAVVTAAWGCALFVTDRGPTDLVWLWPGDLLTSRLIAAMLFTIAVGAAYGVRYVDTARVALGAAAVYGCGVALANLWSVLDNKPIRFSYLLAFATIGLISGAVLWQIPQSPRPVGAARQQPGGDGQGGSAD